MKVQKITSKGVHIANGVLEDGRPLIINSHEYLLLGALISNGVFQSGVFEFNDVGVSDCWTPQEDFASIVISKDIIAKDNSELMEYCNFLIEGTGTGVVSSEKYSVSLTKEIANEVITEADLTPDLFSTVN